MADKKISIGVFGAGHLGKIHLKCIQSSDRFNLIGFYDTDEEVRKTIAADFNTKAFDSPEALMQQVAIVDIVTPTPFHYELALQAIDLGKHLFIEKPVTSTPEEARTLQRLSIEKGIKIQVGHVERFNPAFLALRDISLKPVFIEAHRLATFNPRGTDVSVVLDLMIHDLDLLLSIVQSPLKNIHASGVALVSHHADICNARLEFENGCVANLTASRISLKQMRKLRIFQPDAYLSLDFLEKEAQVIRLHDEENLSSEQMEALLPLDTAKGKKFIELNSPTIAPTNAIQMELESFATAIIEDTLPIVDIEDGMMALTVAHQIQAEMEQSAAKVKL